VPAPSTCGVRRPNQGATRTCSRCVRSQRGEPERSGCELPATPISDSSTFNSRAQSPPDRLPTRERPENQGGQEHDLDDARPEGQVPPRSTSASPLAFNGSNPSKGIAWPVKASITDSRRMHCRLVRPCGVTRPRQSRERWRRSPPARGAADHCRPGREAEQASAPRYGLATYFPSVTAPSDPELVKRGEIDARPPGRHPPADLQGRFGPDPRRKGGL